MENTKNSFEDILQRDGVLVYRNRGISMLPLLRQNRDLFVIEKKDPNIRCKKLDAVLFKRDNGDYVLHRILKVRSEDYWIVGDNCVVGEDIREDQILGILTSVKRDGKTIRVTDKGYLFYVHLWCDAYPIRFLLLRLVSFARRCLSWFRRHVLKRT